jgi:hypothetical protein
MSSDLPVHQERVRAAVLDDLPEGPDVSSEQIAQLREALKAGTVSALQAKDIVAPIRVDRHVLPRALRCPASAIGDPFEWTATFANRTLGIPALRMLVRSKRDVAAAVAASIDDALERGGDLASWLESQSPPARAATLAAVTTWVCRAAVAVPWHVLGSSIDFDVRTWHRPLGRSSPIVYCGRSEAEIWCERPAGRERVLLGLGRADEALIGLDLVARALETGRAPLRHVMVHPASGDVVVTHPDVQLLERAVDDCLTAANVLVVVASGEPPVAVPGGHCWWCSRRPSCSTGQTWTSEQPVRIGGIPVGPHTSFTP